MISRRNFLKKSVYSAPILIALGQFIKPTSVYADGTGGPDGPPGGFSPMSTTTSSSSNKRVRPIRSTRKK